MGPGLRCAHPGMGEEQPALRSFLAQHPLRAGWILLERRCRPDRAANEFAGAIGTDVVEFTLSARCAEGALEAADAGVGRVGGEGRLAALALVAHLQHQAASSVGG